LSSLAFGEGWRIPRKSFSLLSFVRPRIAGLCFSSAALVIADSATVANLVVRRHAAFNTVKQTGGINPASKDGSTTAIVSVSTESAAA
jgi:hypothetical protein